MVAGRIKKYYQQVVLLEQDYIMDTDNQVKHILGSGVSVANMVNFILGEGIEKKEDDFAQEVKRQVQG
jgi:elongation factor Ts